MSTIPNNIISNLETTTTHPNTSGLLYNQVINTFDEYYIKFINSNSTNTITFNEKTQCDVLVVGGGGSGNGGGGGAGALIRTTYSFPRGTYNINVGSGGSTLGSNGSDSSITDSTGLPLLLAKGGGGGNLISIGNVGGSSGGTGYTSTNYFQTNLSTNNMPPGIYGNYGMLGGGGSGGNAIGGIGGAGTIISITSANEVYAAGGSGVLSIDEQILIAQYTFNDNNNLGKDSSPNNYTLTLYNNPIIDTIDKIYGLNSVVFNGSNYFEITNTGAFSPDAFTVTCWCKIQPSPGTYGTIASCRSGAGSGWNIYVYNNNLEFWAMNGSWNGQNITVFPNFATSPVVWRHLAITFLKSRSEVKVYVDNVLVYTGTRGYVNNTGTNLRIGAGTNEIAVQAWLPNGSKLNDFRFYNRVLTSTEINNIYTASNININDSLIALYSFDDMSNLGRDFTIYKRDLTVYPGLTYDSTDKKLGVGSLVFNGSGS